MHCKEIHQCETKADLLHCVKGLLLVFFIVPRDAVSCFWVMTPLSRPDTEADVISTADVTDLAD